MLSMVRNKPIFVMLPLFMDFFFYINDINCNSSIL